MNDDVRLSEFAEDLADLLSVASADEGFLWVNRHWESVLGWSREQLLSRPFLSFVHPGDRVRTASEFHRLFTRKTKSEAFQNRYLTADGSIRWLEWNSARPLENGTIFAVARDVTEHKSAEITARERLRMIDLAEEIGDTGHWRIVLPRGEVTWSGGTFRVYGHDPDSFAPTIDTFLERCHPDERKNLEHAIRKAARGHDFKVEHRIRHADGKYREVVTHGRVDASISGTHATVFGLTRDLSEEKKLLGMLVHSERLASVGTLAAGVAHEINNPLTYVFGNLDMISEVMDELKEIRSDERYDELDTLVREAVDGCERIRHIMKGMKNFARAEREERIQVDIAEALEAACTLSNNRIKHRARLMTDVRSRPLILGDENGLVQVIVNLLVNATQAMDVGDADKNLLDVVLETEDDEAVLRIHDTGPGIPDDVLPRIFDPFFTTKQVGEGTGLGLSICHGIIVGMGGSITVENHPDGGALATLRIPVVESDPRAPELSPRRAQMSRAPA